VDSRAAAETAKLDAVKELHRLLPPDIQAKLPIPGAGRAPLSIEEIAAAVTNVVREEQKKQAEQPLALHAPHPLLVAELNASRSRVEALEEELRLAKIDAEDLSVATRPDRPAHSGVLDPREMVKLMSHARARQADTAAARCLQSRGLTPAVTLKNRRREGDDVMTVADPPQALTPPPRLTQPRLSPRAVRHDGDDLSHLGIHVSRLQGLHSPTAITPPRTPLQLRADRFAHVAQLPHIAPVRLQAAREAGRRTSM
jgi:hypothetical protein